MKKTDAVPLSTSVFPSAGGATFQYAWAWAIGRHVAQQHAHADVRSKGTARVERTLLRFAWPAWSAFSSRPFFELRAVAYLRNLVV